MHVRENYENLWVHITADKTKIVMFET